MEDFQAVASRFINTTRNHLFLTGKAGTGKTTFLKNLSSITHKNFIVVAPTGIAALNAGGVTIHSQFLLPLGTYLPEPGPIDVSEGLFFNQRILASRHPLDSARKQVLRSIDLLVIDEVSMLRADVLDAVDYRMRSVRNNFRASFGGVQVLFIGDLYQLPPVVRRENEAVLRRYYATPWFYEAHALRDQPPVLIQLEKIYRQHDNTFIDLLNNLRNNVVTAEDIDLLNRQYRTAEEIESLREVITLTTHNHKADELNRRALEALESKSHFFTATIENDFPAGMYPVADRLELKVGAQIMFVRNDAEGEYFNGKLATVSEINGSDVWVDLADSHLRYKLKKELWENKKYRMDADQNMSEDVVGSFEQFPVKLAWAITVHKSQGLTFDKAIIDVADAFADGQVYVALSRLRSLDGLILRTRINPRAIRIDQNVVGFVQAHHRPERLAEMMQSGQREFITHLLDHTFDLAPLIQEIRYVLKANPESHGKDVLGKICDGLAAEAGNTRKFRQQLSELVLREQQLLERLEKGAAYYRQRLLADLKSVLTLIAEVKTLKRVKTYLGHLEEIDNAISKRIRELDRTSALIESIMTGNEAPKVNDARYQADRSRIVEEVMVTVPAAPVKKKRKKKKDKDDTRTTYHVTLDYFREGLSIPEIATKRELAESTIESHLARGVEIGDVSIAALLPAEAVGEIQSALESEGRTVTEIYHLLNKRFSHAMIRAVIGYTKISSARDVVI